MKISICTISFFAVEREFSRSVIKKLSGVKSYFDLDMSINVRKYGKKDNTN